MIDRLDVWFDCGYTESGVERPPIGAEMPNPSLTYYQELHPDKGEVFNRLSLKAPFTELMDASYIRVSMRTNNGDDLVIYGWVDSVALRSDTDYYPMTDIYWHVDPWRTWGASAVFKAGTVRRRPANGQMPPQPYPFRYRTAGTSRDLLRMYGNGNVWWVLMNYVVKSGGGEVTALAHIFYPIDSSTGGQLWVSGLDGETDRYPALTYNQTVQGTIEEHLNLSPQAIVSVCISPIPPVDVLGTGTFADPFRFPQGVTGWEANHPTEETDPRYGFFRATTLHGIPKAQVRTMSLYGTMRTDDTKSLAVRTVDGSVIAILPWGMEVSGYDYRIVDNIVSQYIQIRFDGTDSYAEGLCVTIPLPLVSVTDNSWSDYVYSGQREYDIQMRNAQSDQQLVNGLASAFGSGAQGYSIGTLSDSAKMQGAIGRGVPASAASNSMAGMGMGGKLGALSAVGSILGAAASYGADKLWFNGEYQKWEDYAAAHQTNNILMAGDGDDYVFNGTPISLVEMDIDEYSAQQRASDIALYGCHVTEPMTSCQSLIYAGGPLQITNLTVGGEIPVEAKEYIRTMFSNGVRLV